MKSFVLSVFVLFLGYFVGGRSCRVEGSGWKGGFFEGKTEKGK